MKISLPKQVRSGHDKAEEVTEPIRKATSRFVAITDTPKRRRISQRALQALVVACILAGPASCMASNARNSAASPVATQSVDDTSQLLATSTAVGFTRQWMVATQATAQQLLAQMVTPPQRVAFPQDAPAAPTTVEAVAAQPLTTTPGRWTITVHAVGGSAGAGEWYQVPVQTAQTDGRWQAGVITLPGRAAAPAPLTQQPAEDQLQPVLDTDPSVVTAVGFLSAWLGGQSTVDRWTSAGFLPAPLSGQLCSAVHLVQASASQEDVAVLQRLSNPAGGSVLAPSTSASPTPGAQSSPGTGAQVSLQVVATCTTKGAVRSVEYRLGMTQSSGQWAVQSIS